MRVTQHSGRGRGDQYRDPPGRLSFLLVKHTLVDRAARRMQLGGTDVLRALGGRGAGGSGGEPKRGVQGRWKTHAGTPTHLCTRTGPHTQVTCTSTYSPLSTRMWPARVRVSRSHARLRAHTHTHTHTHYTPSHAQSPSVPTCRRAHADAPAGNMHRVRSPPRTHVWKVTPVHTHASLHTRAGGPGPAHIHTQAAHTSAQTPLSPEMCRSQRERKM